MEVTKKNFPELLPLIKESIDECDFLAVDTELTGLSSKVTETSFDSIAERYSKLRENCMQFLIIQFGLSTFKYDPQKKQYTHNDFNFYAFPRPHLKQAPDPKFLCQTSSLHFLASHGFDFNKVIYDGIQYLSLDQEERIKGFLEKKHKNEEQALKLKASKDGAKTNGQKEVNVPEEFREFIAEVHDTVESFLSDDDVKTIELEPCSSYRRKLIYETVQSKHQSGIKMSSVLNNDNERVIVIEKVTDKEEHDQLNLKQETDLNDLDAAIGLRKVLDHISLSKKLIVGHNMLLDIMHILNHFFCPIPEKLDEFKALLNSTFPYVMDTKLLSSSEKLKQFFEDTSLGNLIKTLKGKAFNLPVIELGNVNGYNLTNGKEHEAGYDAYLTGVAYVGLSSKLASLANIPVGYFRPDSSLLKPYVNRIYVMRHYDIGVLNICAPDPEPNRDNVFYVSFPQEWKTDDLIQFFLPYGNIYINWLDDVSALVALKNRENLINAKNDLLNKPSRLYTVRSFSEYQKSVMKDSPVKRSTDVKRTQTSFLNSDSGSKRKASCSTGVLAPILETEDSEAEKAEDSVSTSHQKKSTSVKSKASSSDTLSSKRQKRDIEENDTEVTSTAKVFEEEANW